MQVSRNNAFCHSFYYKPIDLKSVMRKEINQGFFYYLELPD